MNLPNFFSPDVFRLRKEPINSLSYVRAYVRACVSSGPTALTVQYFFLIFCMKLGLRTTLIDIKKIFGQKFFDPQNDPVFYHAWEHNVIALRTFRRGRCAIKLLRVQIFSKIQQLLITILGGS